MNIDRVSYSPYTYNSQNASAIRGSVYNDAGINKTTAVINKATNSPADNKQSNTEQVRLEKRLGLIECETCNNRTYQDGSDDPSVSFKSPAHISPEASASLVLAHEREHVSNETSKAEAEDKIVVSQSIKLESSTCPECGKTYISGGQTTTTTKPDNKKNDYFLDNLKKTQELFKGKLIDIKI